MILGVQYYRAPFPENRYWEKDIKMIKESGFNTIQFWVPWGWVEPEPGKFIFNDYDELIEISKKNDLKFLLSTCAELQPYWIHSLIPDSHMIDHMGNKVISSNRGEAHQGLTPGGCTDNPEVLKKMKNFLVEVANRYKASENFIGWDCWNELRWQPNSDGLVCFCPHTLKAFREWLVNKYGDLDGINKAWKRRYYTISDILPGKLPNRPYTEMMEFEAFLQWRQAKYLKFRYETIKAIDKNHIVSAHGPGPSPVYSFGSFNSYGIGNNAQHALHVGNEWDLAKEVDVFGSSHFPTSQTATMAEFGTGIEITKAAARPKDFWISELEGGTYDASLIKTRLWTCYARGAKAISFWQWRSEVFGCESGMGGIIKDDGNVEERLKIYKETGVLVKENNDLLDQYKTDTEKVGIYFDPNIYNHEWAATGDTQKVSDSLKGYGKALETMKIPYTIVESSHLEGLDELKVLIMHWPIIVIQSAAEKITEFVNKGGFLIIEGDSDSFTSIGLYNYPGKNRQFAYNLGIDSFEKRSIVPSKPYYQLEKEGVQLEKDKLHKDILISFMGDVFSLKAETYFTPLKKVEEGVNSQSISRDEQGNILALHNKLGRGTVIALGSFFGRSYFRSECKEFERFLEKLFEAANAMPDIRIEAEGELQWRSGLSQNKRLLFLINAHDEQNIRVYLPEKYFDDDRIDNLSTGEKVLYKKDGDKRVFEISLKKNDIAILKWNNKS